MIRERGHAPGPTPGSAYGQYHLRPRACLPCRAVPCRGGRRGCLSPFYVDFLGQHVGSKCFFWTLLCRLHQPRGRVPPGAQEVHQRYCCQADTATRTQPADAACRRSPWRLWGHLWQVCCICGMRWDTLRYLAPRRGVGLVARGWCGAGHAAMRERSRAQSAIFLGFLGRHLAQRFPEVFCRGLLPRR